MDKMKNFVKRLIQYIMIPFLLFGAFSCSSTQLSDTNINLYNPEEFESETFEYEHFYFESFGDEKIFYDSIEAEMNDVERYVADSVKNEYYVTEEIISEDYSEKLYASFPENFEIYDVDWEGVLTKFRIGTAVIVFAGILTLSSLNTPVAYVFATAFSEGIKQAILGGTIGGILNAAVRSMQAGNYDWRSIKKYFIEGFADGYMWGAISGTVSGAIKGAVVVNTPGNYFSSDGTSLLGKVDKSGNFYNPNGELLGKAKIGTNGNTYVINPQGEVIYMFGKDGLSSNIINSYAPGLNIIRSPHGRYAGGNFTVEGKKVYKGGKLIGELNEVGDVIGLNQYKGMLLCSVDANGYSTANYMRAIQGGLAIDCYGNITNVFVEATNPGIMLNGAKTIGSYILNNGKEAKVVFDGTYYYLMDASNKIAGLLDDYLNVKAGWNSTIASLANYGVRANREMIIKMIQNNIPYDYGPSFTDDVIAYIQQYGKFPNGFQGHHINNVANFPWLANDPNNIQFYSYVDHLLAHGGKWSNSTHGDLTNLVEIFESIFGGL